VALAAKLPVLGFFGRVLSRKLVVLFCSFMTHGTLHIGVARDSDDPLYLCMAGLAPLGDLRRLGIVRLMTSHARFYRIVGVGYDLGKAGWSGWLVFVAKQTVRARLWHVGLRLIRVLGVGFCRPVACLARYPSVVPAFLQSDFSIVTVGTCVTSRIVDLLFSVLYDRRRSVVADNAKSGWHKKEPGYQSPPENDDAGYQEVANLLGDSIPYFHDRICL